MTDYISRQKAIEAIMDLPNCPNGYSDTYDKECIIGTLEEVPTADVRENVHAEWLPYEFGTKRWHICSACGIADEYINEKGLEAVRRFCPFCGAQTGERREQ